MAGPNYNSPGKFPGPYINDVKKDDSVMEYVPMDDMGIGARKSGLPAQSDVKRDSMSIQHVGGSAGQKG
jgi:hypothetical protein